MNKKIFALLIIFIATVSVVSVFASEELVSHDFGDFKMNIPNAQGDIPTKQGHSNQTIYAVPNADDTTFAFVEYWDTSNTGGNNNTTQVVLDKVKENFTVKTDGDIPSWDTETAGENGYLVSSDDDTQVLVITSSDIRIQQALGSIEFK